MRIPAPAVLLTALAVACTQAATAPRASTASRVQSDFLNNPDVDNGVVYRHGTDFGICWNDGSNGLRVCHRTEQFPSVDCGTFDPIGGVSEQEVVKREDLNDFFSSEVAVNLMGRMWITVRDVTQPGDCYGNLRVAEGWGNFHYNDNDEFTPFNPGDKSTDSFGYKAQGQLSASDGSRVMYSGHAHFTLHPDGTVTSAQNVVTVH